MHGAAKGLLPNEMSGREVSFKVKYRSEGPFLPMSTAGGGQTNL